MNFYNISDDSKYSILWYNSDDSYEPFKTSKCSKYCEHMEYDKDKSVPLNLEKKDRKKVKDLVWTVYSDLLIAEKVIKLFEENNITGFRTQEVFIDGELSELRQMIVEGEIATLDEASGFKKIDVCPHCGHFRHTGTPNGMIIDKDSWNGCDIFHVEEYPWHVIITEKLKILIEKYQLQGAAIVDVCDVKIEPSAPKLSEEELRELLEEFNVKV